MPLLSESPTVLPIHRKILAFSFIGWIFDFYDLLLLSFLVSSTSLVKAVLVRPCWELMASSPSATPARTPS